MIPIGMSLLSLGMRNWRCILIIVSLLASGFFIAWQIQGVRVEKLKVENSNLQSQISKCWDANKTNQGTIEKLKNEITSAEKICTERLKINKRKADRIRQIDEIIPPLPQTAMKKNDGGIGEKVNIAAYGDALLDELNGMFDTAADHKN